MCVCVPNIFWESHSLVPHDEALPRDTHRRRVSHESLCYLRPPTHTHAQTHTHTHTFPHLTHPSKNHSLLFVFLVTSQRHIKPIRNLMKLFKRRSRSISVSVTPVTLSADVTMWVFVEICPASSRTHTPSLLLLDQVTITEKFFEF